MILHNNMSQREAKKLARYLGCTVEPKHKNGEIVFTHPAIEKPYTVSVSNKDIGPGFISWIKPIYNRDKPKPKEKLPRPGTLTRRIMNVCMELGTYNNEVHPKEVHKHLPDVTYRQVLDGMNSLYSQNHVLIRIRTGVYVITRYIPPDEGDVSTVCMHAITPTPVAEPLPVPDQDQLFVRLENYLSRLESAIKRIEEIPEVMDARKTWPEIQAAIQLMNELINKGGKQ